MNQRSSPDLLSSPSALVQKRSWHYDQVRRFITALSSATSISKRREAADQLVAFFKNAKNRTNLAHECITAAIYHASSHQTSVFRGKGSSSTSSAADTVQILTDPLSHLKSLIRQVIQVSIESSQSSISNSKSKLNLTDITLPCQLLTLADVHDTASHKTKSPFYASEPFTFESFDRYRNTHVGASLLSNKEVQALLTFCLNNLSDDPAKAVADHEFMDTLKTLCSRVDYVCHFKLPDDFTAILSELETRIMIPPKDTKMGALVERQTKQSLWVASYTLDQLMTQSLVQLRLDLQIFLRPCLRMVSDWTRTSYALDYDIVAQHLFSAIIPLMATYPKSAVSVLADQSLGYHLWEYALKWWDRTPLVHKARDVLVEFFSVLLLVGEISGNIHGFLPGDLGPMGAISLDATKLHQLRSRILSDNIILSYVSVASSPNSAIVGGKKIKHANIYTFTPLSKRDRRYYELCARILRCSQRIFLIQAELETALEQDILGQLKDHGLSSDVANQPDDIYQESPWVEYIVKPICMKSAESYILPFKSQEKDMENGTELTSSQNLVTMSIRNVTFCSDPLIMVGYLQLIAACAEIFPRGECWSSTNTWMRSKFCPFSDSLNGSMDKETFCSMSTMQDLARLIRLITTILEHYAGKPRVESLQAWALICLLKLTEATVCVKRYLQLDKESSSGSLCSAWIFTWTTLFRSELRYTSITSDLSRGRLGELVVMLMIEIVKGRCTESTHLASRDITSEFMSLHQEEIWNLPIYRSMQNVASVAVELLAAILQTVGLREGTDDSFRVAISESEGQHDKYVNASRRARLALFCIGVLRSFAHPAMDVELRKLMPYVAASLSALTGGIVPMIITTYRLRSLKEFLCAEDSINAQDIYWSETQSQNKSAKLDITLLWRDTLFPFSEVFSTEISSSNWRGLHDIGLRLTPSWATEERRWCSQTNFELHRPILSTISWNGTKRVRDFTLHHLRQLTRDFGLQSGACFLPLMKCILTVYLSFEDSEDFYEIPGLFQEGFDLISSHFVSAIERYQFCHIALDLIGVVRLLRSLYEFKMNTELLVALNSDSLSRIFNQCKKNLELWIDSRDPAAAAFQLLSYEMMNTYRSSDDDDAHTADDVDRTFDAHYQSERPSKRPKFGYADSDKVSSYSAQKVKEDPTVVEKECYPLKDEVNIKCLWLSALLLLLIEPTYRSCKYIADYLMKPCATETITRGNLVLIIDSYDPHDSLLGASLFLSNVPQYDSDILSLFTEIIWKGRLNAPHRSFFHMMGFLSFSNYLSRYTTLNTSGGLSDLDYQNVTSILNPECSETHREYERISRRSLRDRPYLRVIQLKAARQSFLNGDTSLHDHFDLIYAEVFVKPQLVSFNTDIREAAIGCLASALKIFISSQEQIVAEVLSLFQVDDLNDRTEVDVIKWILRVAVSGPNKTILSNNLRDSWIDLFQSVAADVCECLGIMGGLVTDDICSQIVVHMAKLSLKRRNWNALFFRTISTMSLERQYHDVDAFISSNSILLVDFMLNGGFGLSSIPIFYLKPSLYLYQIRLHLHVSLDYTDDLNKLSLRDFLANNSSAVVPHIVLRNKIDSEKYLSEISKVVSDGNANGCIPKLIRKYFNQIFAFILPLIHLEMDNEKSRAQGLEGMNFITKFMRKETIDKYLVNNCYLILRNLVQLSGKRLTIYKRLEVDDDAYVRSMYYISSQISLVNNLNYNPAIDIFQKLGSSLTEVSLHALEALRSAITINQKNEAWKSIALICKIAAAELNDGNSAETIFLVLKLLLAALETETISMRLSILSEVDFVVNKLLEMTGIPGGKPSCGTWGFTFHSLVRIHQECSLVYHTELKQHVQDKERIERHSARLMLVIGKEDLTSRTSDFNEVITVDRRLHTYEETMILSYDILRKMQLHAEKHLYIDLCTQEYLPQCMLTELEQNILRSLHEKFSITSLTDKLQQHLVRDTISCDLTFSLNSLRTYREGFLRGIKETNLSPDHRNNIILRVLDRLIDLFADTRVNFSETEKDIGSKIKMELLRLCSPNYPSNIRSSSSKCLGQLFLNQALSLETSCNADSSKHLYEVNNSSLPRFHDDPLVHIHTLAMRMLATYVHSHDLDRAITAIDTIYALLNTTSGQRCYSCENDENTKRILDPIKALAVSSSRGPFISEEKDLYNIIRIYDAVGNPKLSSLCWSKALWSGSGIGFVKWIRHVTFILIKCCYEPEHYLNDQGIKGRCDFFYPCTRICLIDSNFATLLFPAIIYDILNSNLIDESATVLSSSSLSKASKQNIHRRDFMGLPDDRVNIILTECLSQVFWKTDPEAITLITNVVNMLRRVTESRFIILPQPPNASLSKERIYPDHLNSSKKQVGIIATDENYNIGLQPTKIWTGRPYGTVLRFNGLDVAAACAEVHNWEGALYYSEFYADNILGSSGGSLFERLVKETNYECGQYSISGFGAHALITSPEPLITRVTRFHDIYYKCLNKLHEVDEMNGIFQQYSYFRSTLTGPAKHDTQQLFNIDGQSDMISLLHLDAQMQSRSIANDHFKNENVQDIISCTKRLGMRHILRNYISSIVHEIRVDDWNDVFQDYLAEENWNMMLWSNIDELNATSSSLSNVDNTIGMSFNDERGFGFNQHILDIIHALSSQDHSSFKISSSRCRMNMCDALSSNHYKSMGYGEQLMMRLTILNDLDDIGTTLFDPCLTNESLVKILDAQFMTLSDFTHTQMFQDVELLFSTREMGLKILYKRMEHHRDAIGRALKNHILLTCKLARQCGAPNVSEAAISRLFMLDFPKSFMDYMLVALEEARITKSYGDSTLAVTKTKAMISYLQGLPMNEQNNDYILFLAESCLQCGEWLVETKIEAAPIVLEKYLRPAASLSQTAYIQSQTSKSAKLLSDANFALGDFAATCYDNIQTKMKSHDYKVGLLSSSSRAAELKECQKMLTDLQNELRKELETSKNSKMKGITQSRKSASNDQKDPINCLEKRIHEVAQHIRTLQREVDMDTTDRSAMDNNFSMYLALAIQSYGTALCYCDTSSNYSSSVIRMISLWFQQSDIDHQVHSLMENFISEIPSYHFVPLTYQIFSRIDRMSTEDSQQTQATQALPFQTFQRVLRLLIEKMCVDHPYHCLVQLIALSNGNKVGQGVGGRQADLYLSNIGEHKVEACKLILNKILHDGPKLVSALIKSYTAVMNSYNTLAMAPTAEIVEKNGTKNISLRDVFSDGNVPTTPSLDRCLGPSHRKIFESVPCILTKTPLLRPSKDYGDGTTDPVGSERIFGFDSYFSLTESGIHRPKIVTCVGTSGRLYKQLVKGEDDIRQDAIMQQVFATINNLLRKNDLSVRDRKVRVHSSQDLRIITYSCVPITPVSGIIEWVDDTIPFGDYLVDKKVGKEYQIGAHSRYYPGEWGNSLCRTHLKNSPSNQMRQSYDQICNHFSPAFRFFFLERFSHDMSLWFGARKRYVKSCAVNSIAGHILGIGDRHALNILVHQKTGEMVHIDFGIVFEQGKLLPIPEIVPFRLTRDIVDGMGPVGTEGIFIATAITTLTVLRENTNSLMTILSAVVSDPLYKWCMNPVTARLRQRDKSDDDIESEWNTNKNTHILSKSDDPVVSHALSAREINDNESDAASRTLAKIMSKLQGFEDGGSGERQTVEGQVRMLIQAAKDPSNLAHMYCGWAPWL